MGIKVKVAGNIDRTNAHFVMVDGRSEVWGTDADGKGLYIDGRQVQGRSQFSLRGIKDKAGKIRREAQRQNGE